MIRALTSVRVVCLVEEGAMKRVRYGPIDELPLQETARLRHARSELREEVKRLRAQLEALQERVAGSERNERALAARAGQLVQLVRKIRGLPPKRDFVCPNHVIFLKY